MVFSAGQRDLCMPLPVRLSESVHEPQARVLASNTQQFKQSVFLSIFMLFFSQQSLMEFPQLSRLRNPQFQVSHIVTAQTHLDIESFLSACSSHGNYDVRVQQLLAERASGIIQTRTMLVWKPNSVIVLLCSHKCRSPERDLLGSHA